MKRTPNALPTKIIESFPANLKSKLDPRRSGTKRSDGSGKTSSHRKAK
jgi:hypothetical protein